MASMKRIIFLIFAALAVGAVAATSWPVPQTATNAFDAAVEAVRREAAYAAGIEPDEREYRLFVGLAAMGYVQTNVSPSRYGALVKAGEPPPSGTEMCLLTGAGICGNQVQAFVEIVEALGVPARGVQIFFEEAGRRHSHIVAEVEWGGTWHMFDVTWGYVPLDAAPYDVMSVAERRARPATVEWFNEGNPWTRRYRLAGLDPFSYLSAPDADVMTDGQGVIHPYVLTAASDRVDYSFEHLPRFVGRSVRWSGNVGEVVQEVSIPAGFDTLHIDVGGRSCEAGTLEIDGEIYPVEDLVQAPVQSSFVIVSVVPDGRPCHFMIDELYATRSADQG